MELVTESRTDGRTIKTSGASLDGVDFNYSHFAHGGSKLDDFFHSSMFKKREKKDGRDSGRGGASSSENSSAVDEEVANLVQKINNAASKNALKASNKNMTSSSSSTANDTTVSKCCRCTTTTTIEDIQHNAAVAADNAPSSTTIEPENKAMLNSKLNELKVSELKLECKKRQLAVSGSKCQIMERLKPYEDAIVAGMEASQTKFATASNNSTSSKFASIHDYEKSLSNSHVGSSDTESFFPKLDLSVIDAVASNTTTTLAPSRTPGENGTKSLLYRESGESTVRDIINDYLQQQQYNNKNLNGKIMRKSTTNAIVNDEKPENCASSFCTFIKDNKEFAYSCKCDNNDNSRPSTEGQTIRNNTATFSFAQMGSGGHFTFDGEIVNKHDNGNSKQDMQRPKRQQKDSKTDVSPKSQPKIQFDEDIKKTKNEHSITYDNKSQPKAKGQQNFCNSNSTTIAVDKPSGEIEDGNLKKPSSFNFHDLLSSGNAPSFSISKKSLSDTIVFPSISNRSTVNGTSTPRQHDRNENEGDLLMGCCDAKGRFLVSDGVQNDSENPPSPIQFDLADPRSIANTLSNHEQMLSYQQKKIYELQRELAYSQQNLRHQQQMILTMKKSQSLHHDVNGGAQTQAEYWLSQLDMKALRNSIIQHRAQQQQLQMQVADQEELIAKEQQLQEQIHVDQCVEDIVRLIRQDPRTALLIVQLLRKYQLEHIETKSMEPTCQAQKSRSIEVENTRKPRESEPSISASQFSTTTCSRCCDGNTAKRFTPIVTLDDEDCNSTSCSNGFNQNTATKSQYNVKNAIKSRKRVAENQSRYSTPKSALLSGKMPRDYKFMAENKKAKRSESADNNGTANAIDMEEIFRSVLQDTSRTNSCHAPAAPIYASPDSTNSLNANESAHISKQSHNQASDTMAAAYATEKETSKAGLNFVQSPNKINKLNEDQEIHTEVDFSCLNTPPPLFGHPSSEYNDANSDRNALNNYVSANIMRNKLNQCSDNTNMLRSDSFRFNLSKLSERAGCHFGRSNVEYTKNHAFDDLMDVLRDDQEKSSLGIAECDTAADFALGYTSDELVNFLADDSADNFHAEHTFHYTNTENAQSNVFHTHKIPTQHDDDVMGHLHPNAGLIDSNTSSRLRSICPQLENKMNPSMPNNSGEQRHQQLLQNSMSCCPSYDTEIAAPASHDAASTSRDAFSSASSALSYSSMSGSNAPSDFMTIDFHGIDDNHLFTPTSEKCASINSAMHPCARQEIDWLDNIESIFDPEHSFFYYNQTFRPSPDTALR